MDEPTVAIERAMVAIRRLQARRTLSRLSVERTGNELDTAVFGVLDAIDDADRQERPCTVSAVARALHVDQPRASRLAAQAVAAGLVERQADQADGRKTVLALTPDGRATITDMHSFRRSVFAQVMCDWPDADQRTFSRLLSRFAERYETVVSPDTP